jgi:GTP-binding protein HflX
LARSKRSELSVIQERAILVGVILPKSNADPRDPLGELASLAKTAGAKVVGSVLQNRRRLDAGTYVGSGKVVEIAQLAQAEKANVVVFDNDLSPGQINAIEILINKTIGERHGAGVRVLDRSELILDIFATRARTHEARLQVELAQMEYTYPRLTRMWAHLERISGGAGGGIGARGPGEMQLEIDRRLARRRVQILKEEISTILQRKDRQIQQRKSEHYTICIVGYTNAGKSTLFNTLTSAGVEADDRLFATLDTRTRAWRLDRSTVALLSDTVGFVRDLPHHLVASFKATLQEAIHADLLLHVLDVGHSHAQQQYDSVLQVLKEIGAGEKPQILLLNKIDTPEGGEQWPVWKTLNNQAIPISARGGAGMVELHEAVIRHMRGEEVEVELEAAMSNGRLISFIEHHSRVESREFQDGRIRMTAVMGKRLLADLSRNDQVEVKKVREGLED